MTRDEDIDVLLDETVAQLAGDVRVGLAADQKWLPPKWFYDKRGSDLFDAITRLGEYYPTEAERSILAAHAKELVAGVDTLIEIGSGTSDKTRTLLDAAVTTGLRRFVAFDVSDQTVRDAVAMLEPRYRGLDVSGVVGDFEHHLDRLPSGGEHGRRLVVLLGGTIGNFFPGERAGFLRGIAGQLDPGDGFLLGTDLVKDTDRLVRAYDDAQGITAEFNRNVLHVINRELDADFPVDAFEHRAIWNADDERIEIYLVAPRALTVTIPHAGATVRFDAGESIRTEISTKFRRETVTAELEAAGLGVDAWWTDPAGDFALSLSSRR